MSKKKFVENIAEEIVEMISDTKKLVSLSQDIENIKTQQNEYFKNINRLENKIEKHINDFKIDIIEIERMITEKYEKISREQEKLLFEIKNKIQELERKPLREEEQKT